MDLRRPVRRDGLDQSDNARGANDVHAASERVRGERQTNQRGVASVTAAVDADSIRIRITLAHRPFLGVQQIVMHGAAPLTVAGIEELLPITG